LKHLKKKYLNLEYLVHAQLIFKGPEHKFYHLILLMRLMESQIEANKKFISDHGEDFIL